MLEPSIGRACIPSIQDVMRACSGAFLAAGRREPQSAGLDETFIVGKDGLVNVVNPPRRYQWWLAVIGPRAKKQESRALLLEPGDFLEPDGVS